ncbi:unnamed protein product [Sympodiomycopsis kandeliae]
MATTTTTRISSRPKQNHHQTAQSRDNLLAALSDVVTHSEHHPPPPSQPARSRSTRSDQDRYPLQSSNSHSSLSYAGAQPMTTRDPAHHLPATSLLPGEDPLAPPVPTKSEQVPTSTSTAGGMAAKFANAFRRQTNQDKAAKKAQNSGLGRSKTVATRMDVIDKLDVSGIHGNSLFHHDSPYDACSPHANRSTRRAPVGAFDPNIDPMTGRPYGQGRPGASASTSTQQQQQQRKGLSPLAASTLQKMGEADAAGDMYSSADSQYSHADEKQPSLSQDRPPFLGRGSRSVTSPLVPSLPMTGNQASTSAVNLPPSRGAGGSHHHGTDTASVMTESSDWESDRYGRGGNGNGRGVAPAPNAIADMWGHVAEPWQDFAQPKQDKSRSRQKNGGGGGTTSPGQGSGMLSPYDRNGSRDGPPSAASSVFDMEAVMTGKSAAEKKRGENIGGVSPFPEPDYDRAGGGYDSTAPKRSKSLIKRIKSARQNPNVPPPDDDGVEMSPSGGGRARSKRYGPHAHRHSPSNPAESSPRSNEWSTPRSGYADGSVGRSSARREEHLAPPSSGTPSPGGYYEGAEATSSGDEYRSGGRNRSPRPPQDGTSSPGVGRSGSIFGRFGRKNKQQPQPPTSA